jgi:hypothetical protein
MEDSDKHPKNAYLPIDVTLSGIIIEDSNERAQNTDSPIDVTLSEITIDDINRFPENATNSVSTCTITISLFWSVDVAIVD